MTEIKMPSAGQTTDEAIIASVNVKVGDTVKRGDVLVEAETDKAVLPVESFAAGDILAVLVSEGDKVNAGSLLVVVGKKGEQYQSNFPSSADAATPTPAVSISAPAMFEEQDEYLPIVKDDVSFHMSAQHPTYPAMPNAKILAHERNIDLAAVPASNGHFIKRMDIENYISASMMQSEAEYEVMAMTNIRRVIGRRMKESLSEIPCWQCAMVIKMDTCMALRDTYKSRKGIKLSYNDIMAKAIAVASRRFPLVNARYECDEVRIYKHTNVGLAVALDGALVVPVVKDIDTKGLEQISLDYKQQIVKAREGKLTPADMGCGSITISNLGMYDVDQFIAIDNPPESCILAVGAIKIKPEWDGEKFIPVHVMTVTGSFDHRIIDGAYGAQFLQELKTLMEDPSLMLC